MSIKDLSFNLRARMDRRLSELKLSPIQAAQRAGLERSYIRDFLNHKKASIRSDRYEQVAKALDWSVADLLGVDHAHAVIDAMAEELSPSRVISGDQLVGARDLPIYAATAGGDGHMIVTTDVIERVRRPAVLEGVTGAYGILIVGESMAKAYRQGDMALVHPGLQPLNDEVHIFYDHDPRSGEAESMIKNLVSYTADKWRLEQFNPEKKFAVDRVDWPICHRVVGKYNRR